MEQQQEQQQATYKKNSFAQAAMVLGIIAIFMGFLSGLGGMVCGALGLIFAMLSRGEEPMVPAARLGMFTSLIGMVLGILLLVMLFTNGSLNVVSDTSNVI